MRPATPSKRLICRLDSLEHRLLLAFVSPDVSWGDAGLADTAVGQIHFSKLLDDGKTLAIAEAPTGEAIAVLKLNPDGSPDLSYGNDGARYQIPMNFADIHSVITQPDGKMLVTGGNNQILFVARLMPDGRIDANFGINGLADRFSTPEIIEGSSPSAPIGGIVVQSDGSILAAGSVYHSFQDHNSPVAALVRLNPDGSLDMNYGNAGLVIIENVEGVRPQALALQSDGKVILIGNAPGDGGYITRLNPDGSTDTTFGGGDGYVLSNVLTGDDQFQSLVALPDDKLLVGGGSYNSVGAVHPTVFGLPLVMRFNSNGAVDTSFADDGVFTTEPVTGTVSIQDKLQLIDALTIDSQGRIVASAHGKDGEGRLIVYRLTSGGLADNTFAPGGKVSTSSEFYAESAWVRSDDRIVINGSVASDEGAIAMLDEQQPVELGSNGTIYIHGTDSADTMTVTPDGTDLLVTFNGAQSSFDSDEVTGLNVDLGAGDDVLSAAISFNCTVAGGTGADSITTGDGNDRITDSGNGNDTIRSGNGNDSINAGDGNDQVVTGSGQATVNGGAGNDSITVGDGRMLLNGGTGHDTITTGASDESQIFGDTGDDIITTTGSVIVRAGPEGATSETDNDDVTIKGGRATVTLSYGNNVVRIESSKGASVGGGPGNDLIITGSGDDHIDPHGGNDTVYSNGGNDYIAQLGDFDYIDSGSGNDTVDTGSHGPPLPDEVHTQSGNDFVVLRNGGVAHLGSGNDRFDATKLPGVNEDTVPVTVYGNGGDDSIVGSGASDLLNGGDGNDTIRGAEAKDRIYGGAGNDQLFGDSGGDRIFIDDGELDQVNGGGGTDTCDADALDQLTSVEATS